MLSARENFEPRSSPSKAAGISPSKSAALSPSKGGGVSPFKRGEPSRARSAFTDKTNMSPSPRGMPESSVSPSKHAGSPSKGTTPFTARPFTRQRSFVTPAGNVGRAGQIKARIGEMMDAEMDAVVTTPAPAPRAVPEEELYPEVEYMPPSTTAYDPPYHFPEALDGYPRAKDAAQMLAAAPLAAAGDAPVPERLVPPELDDPLPDLPTYSARSRRAAQAGRPGYTGRPRTSGRPSVERSRVQTDRRAPTLHRVRSGVAPSVRPGVRTRPAETADALAKYTENVSESGASSQGFPL